MGEQGGRTSPTAAISASAEQSRLMVHGGLDLCKEEEEKSALVFFLAKRLTLALSDVISEE